MKFRSLCVLSACFGLILAGCGKQQPAAENTGVAPGAAAGGPVVQLDRIEPGSTGEKLGFNVQPDGQSALVVVGTIPGGSTVLWNGQPLRTVGGGSQGWAAATVPAKLYETPGVFPITVAGPEGKPVSGPMDFTVYSKTGPAPAITQLYPASAAKGAGFNVQPNGESALGVAGEGFRPGVKLFLDSKEMRTVFGKATGLSAAIPAAAVARAGAHEVWVENPDGKRSGKTTFKIE